MAASLRAQLRIPVIGSPLFIVSTPDLVVAQCEAGILGSFPALNARNAQKENVLHDWISAIKSRTSKPFAVNQIVHRSNPRLMTDMGIIVEHQVPVVITSLGARPEVNEAVHSYGGLVFHDVISNEFAKKAIDKGADGLIAVAAGAGGHAGTLSPFALLDEIREWFDGPVALAGAIGSGSAIAGALAAGADFAYVGSRFIATNEANASEEYKSALVDGSAQDIIYSNLFTGVHGNYLKSSILKTGLDPDNLPTSDPSQMDFSGSKAWRDIWGSGQGIGAISQVEPVQAVVDRLEAEYRQARHRFASV